MILICSANYFRWIIINLLYLPDPRRKRRASAEATSSLHAFSETNNWVERKDKVSDRAWKSKEIQIGK